MQTTNNDITINAGVFRYAYYDKIGQFPWAVSFLFPFADISANIGTGAGTSVNYGVAQIGDQILTLSLWGIANASSKTYIGFTQYITFPYGEYKDDRVLNFGSNMWQFKEELGISQGFGPFQIEINPNVTFFTNNNDYTAADLTLTKDNVYAFETHLIWNINKSFWVSGFYEFQNGGETKIGGVSNGDKLNDHTAGIGVAYHITPSTQIMFKYRDTFASENNYESKDLGLRFAWFW